MLSQSIRPNPSANTNASNALIATLEKNLKNHEAAVAALKGKDLAKKASLIALYKMQQSDTIVKLIMADSSVEPYTIKKALKSDTQGCIQYTLSCFEGENAPKGASAELLAQMKLFSQQFDLYSEKENITIQDLLASVDATLAESRKTAAIATGRTYQSSEAKATTGKATKVGSASSDYSLMVDARETTKKPTSSSSYQTIRNAGISLPTPASTAPVVVTKKAPAVTVAPQPATPATQASADDILDFFSAPSVRKA